MGNLYELGNFDQCLRSEDETKPSIFVKQYCLINISVKMPGMTANMTSRTGFNQMSSNFRFKGIETNRMMVPINVKYERIKTIIFSI